MLPRGSSQKQQHPTRKTTTRKTTANAHKMSAAAAIDAHISNSMKGITARDKELLIRNTYGAQIYNDWMSWRFATEFRTRRSSIEAARESRPASLQRKVGKGSGPEATDIEITESVLEYFMGELPDPTKMFRAPEGSDSQETSVRPSREPES